MLFEDRRLNCVAASAAPKEKAARKDSRQDARGSAKAIT